ncbi:MAG TPA: glycosyltransferase family 2 protein [Verrucomicrobiae bacterium]
MFSVITPSFRGGEWLRLCLASVADQQVPLEHIVQDAGSDDGTLNWLLSDARVKPFVEKDQGMYDALNRGFQRAQGQLAAWLNCDEQYLPGTLGRVCAWFDTHPDVDVLFGDVVMVDPEGNYVSHRKMQVPRLYHTWTCHLSTLSCAMFFRRSLVSERGYVFDPKLRAGGDGEWMVRLLRDGVRMGTLNEFTSVFTRTGRNLGSAPAAAREARELRRTAPAWARILRPFIVGHHRTRRLLGGMYSQRPFSYEIYTRHTAESRTSFRVARPRFR